jgi:hypothetical protein
MKIKIDQINSFNLDVSTMEEKDHLLSDIDVQYTMYKSGDKLVGNFKIGDSSTRMIHRILIREIEDHFKRLYDEL